MLGVLRDDGDAKGLLTSAPTQVDLARLIANVEAAGVPVTLRYEGDFPADIPESVRLNGFRILQEALTNVVKHAGKASATVTIGRRPGIAWFEVVDDGRGITGEPSRDGTGAGLTGMRERVGALRRTSRGRTSPGRRVPRRRLAPVPACGRAREAGVDADAMTLRVVVADDQALVRAGFRVLVDSEEDLEVVGEAADGDEAVQVTLRTRPDVVLMDVRMPVFDGIEATRRIIAADLATKVLILTTFDLDEYVYEGLRAGASGFLLKDTPPAQLLDGVRLVAGGRPCSRRA